MVWGRTTQFQLTAVSRYTLLRAVEAQPGLFPPPCTDCCLSGERAPRSHELLLLPSAAEFHQSHQHPPALPADQHSAGPPDGQGSEGPHGHQEGKAGLDTRAGEVELLEGCASHLWEGTRCGEFLSLLHPLKLKASADGDGEDTNNVELGNISWCHMWLSGCAGSPHSQLMGSVGGGGSYTGRYCSLQCHCKGNIPNT